LFGKLHIVPCVVDYLQRYPHTLVSVALLDRVVNLLEEGFDAGIRIGKLPDSNMRAVPVGFIRPVICASPAYLRANGVPKEPQHLRDHTIVTFGGSINTQQWPFTKDGESFSIRVKPRLSVSSGDSPLEVAASGFGITRSLSYQAASYLAEKKLKLILEDYEPQEIPIHIVHREGREMSAKLRAFIDVVVETLRNNTTLNPGSVRNSV